MLDKRGLREYNIRKHRLRSETRSFASESRGSAVRIRRNVHYRMCADMRIESDCLPANAVKANAFGRRIARFETGTTPFCRARPSRDAFSLPQAKRRSL